MISPFQKLAQKEYSQEPEGKKNPYSSPFQQMAESNKLKESGLKSTVRSVLQIPQGIAEITPPGLAASAWQLLGMGEVLDPEEIEHIKMVSQREGIPFDEEAYMNAAQQALQSVPTVSNIAREVEERTGLPLEAKTKLQKGIRLASSAGKAAPGSLSQKGVSSITAPAVKLTLERLGVPEPLADLGGFGIGVGAGSKTPSISIGKSTKPSGLTTRRYENLKKETPVSPSRLKRINESVENDFRNITESIVKESPVEKTYNALKEDLSFKEKIGDQFKEVEKLAESLPESFSSKEFKVDLAKTLKEKTSKGISPSEYDVDYQNFMKNFLKETPKKDISAFDLVSQYRKNNKALSELYEPGKSRAFNRAKKDAILDYNKVIAESIEKKYPQSEFGELFKVSNKRWTEIKDSELLDKFMDDMFNGKINFEKGKKFFNKDAQESFKRAFGKENYPKFEMLMKDLMSTEKANSLLKAAESKGFGDLAKTAATYLIHPKLAYTRFGVDAVKGMYKSLLDKPKLSIIWDEGIKAMEKGDFAKAESRFNILDSQLSPKENAVKKFLDHKKNSQSP